MTLDAQRHNIIRSILQQMYKKSHKTRGITLSTPLIFVLWVLCTNGAKHNESARLSHFTALRSSMTAILSVITEASYPFGSYIM
jgi:hypothetical protein